MFSLEGWGGWGHPVGAATATSLAMLVGLALTAQLHRSFILRWAGQGGREGTSRFMSEARNANKSKVRRARAAILEN